MQLSKPPISSPLSYPILSPPPSILSSLLRPIPSPPPYTLSSLYSALSSLPSPLSYPLYSALYPILSSLYSALSPLLPSPVLSSVSSTYIHSIYSRSRTVGGLTSLDIHFSLLFLAVLSFMPSTVPFTTQIVFFLSTLILLPSHL